MSSPLDRDFGPDEPSPYAPKWVRDAADARRGRTAERHGMAPKAPENLDGEDLRRYAANPAAANEPVLVDRYRLPPSLEPTLMPEPWPVARTRSALGLLMRFAVAVAIAAVVALFVVGKFPTSWLIAGKAEKQDSPSFGVRFSGQNARTAQQPKPAPAQLILSQEGPRGAGEAFPLGVTLTRAMEGASVVVDGLATGSTLTTGRATGANSWRIPAAELRNAVVRPPRGFAGPMDVAVELRLPDDTPVDRKSLRLEWAAAQSPASTAAQPPASPAKSFPIRQLEREEIADLMRRGEAFVATGDLASARLVLQRAAEGGDARAALTLAGTYDPIVLEKLGIQGFASDIAAARTWYERAKEFGSAEAPRRLEMLASRAR
jgi:hypothetical protein